MVKMFKLRYVGFSYSKFTMNEFYAARITKCGQKVAVCNNLGKWDIVQNKMWAKFYLDENFEKVETLFARNHKQAIKFGEIYRELSLC